MKSHLPDVFSKNRSEESREDNWSEFVVPPFLNDLGIKSQSKAIVIVGGRGCGKTTLLRYFCHATQFSPRRPNLPKDALSHIGLYWRADTNFLNAFVGGEQTSETWRAAFEHLLACELGKEIINSLRNLNCNPERQSDYGGLDDLDLSALQDFDPSLGNTLNDLETYLQKSRRLMSVWVNNLDTIAKPTFLPADIFLRTLVDSIQKQLPYIADATFAVFIDEYENLRDEQQHFINGLLKHGSPPFIYNIAMKRNGWHTSQTTGSESIQLVADYREVDLEEEISKYFDLFAAELLFFRLAEHEPGLLGRVPIVPDQLRSVEHIEQRYSNEEYRSRVLAAADQLLPRVNERVAAKAILTDERLKGRLKLKIESALKKRELSTSWEHFVDDRFPEASVVMSALLHRPREKPAELLEEFEELKAGRGNRLSVTSDLISNNLFGCVNSIYLDAGRPSILFSGFTSLTLIARGNIRYLLELIHRIFKAFDTSDREGEELPCVTANVQTVAVKEASELILSTVSGHGTHGPQLYTLAQCLGSIFRERHKSDRQSETEINHFTISSGEISPKLHGYLLEAEKWSVLFLTKETKMKAVGAVSVDYVLNPIFSPCFQISFRKKRSMQISAVQLQVMLEGDQVARDTLVRELGRKDSTDDDHPDLFGGALA
jgi:hypothetical protein